VRSVYIAQTQYNVGPMPSADGFTNSWIMCRDGFVRARFTRGWEHFVFAKGHSGTVSLIGGSVQSLHHCYAGFLETNFLIPNHEHYSVSIVLSGRLDGCKILVCLINFSPDFCQVCRAAGEYVQNT